mgnify:CR=1 FL=1
MELAWYCVAASIVPADARILSSTECTGAAAAEDRGAYRLTTCGEGWSAIRWARCISKRGSTPTPIAPASDDDLAADASPR